MTQEQEEALAKAWREIWAEGYSLGYERGCEDATDWEWGSNKTSFTKETEREMEWEASETQARLKRLVSPSGARTRDEDCRSTGMLIHTLQSSTFEANE